MAFLSTQQRVSETSKRAGEVRGDQHSIATLETRSLSRWFGDRERRVEVLEDLSFQARAGEFVCIVGPSGAGKTTLLRSLAGLLQPSSGAVLLDGRPLREPAAEIAVVFQDYSRSLMPWLHAIDNVALPLQGKGISKAQRHERAADALGLVGLAHAAKRYPWQLSGGMQQRVAIARALAYHPEVLLMDEPFASLDAQTRFDLEDLVLGLKSRLGMTTVFVTHDIDEAVYLGDRVIVIGGSPATVVREIEIDLATPRDQIATKATVEFARYRTDVLTLIRELSRPKGTESDPRP